MELWGESLVRVGSRDTKKGRSENIAACRSNTDGTRECHIEGSKSDREGKILYGIPYVWNLKRNYTNELTYKTDSQT